ncbi:hypothetical protein OG21DRAFT_1491316 [Imleria badia]|nr:hypothetical protein OG21DRAFT_1491316 [Imleria badia]
MANQGPNMPSSIFPLSPSATQPRSVPSLYIGSTVTSITPSSSISACMERSNKRKADNDNVSMALATRGSAVTMASGASTGSRKWHAARPSQDISGLRDDLSMLQTTFQENMQVMEHVFQSSSSKISNQSSQVIAMLNAANAAAEKRHIARTTLLEREKDFLSLEELVVMFDVLGESNDHVDGYLLLATRDHKDPKSPLEDSDNPLDNVSKLHMM